MAASVSVFSVSKRIASFYLAVSSEHNVIEREAWTFPAPAEQSYGITLHAYSPILRVCRSCEFTSGEIDLIGRIWYLNESPLEGGVE